MSGTEPEQPWATLAEAIEGIRTEISDAMTAGKDENVRFDVGPVELEFSVEVQRELSAHAGVKVWVVDIGGAGGRSGASSHRVKIILNPVDVVTGRSVRVGDQIERQPRRRSG